MHWTPDEIHGRHGAYLSNAALWSACARRLLQSGHSGETELALVALWKCLSYALMIVEPKHGIAPHTEALHDSPLSVEELRKARDRARGFRDEMLHLQDINLAGRGFTVSWTRDPPYLTYKSTVNRKGGGGFTHDQITRPEVEALLDRVDPWLKKHYGEWIEVERARTADSDE